MNSNGQADIGYWKMIEMQKDPVAWMLADKEAEHIRSIMAVQHDFVPEGCVEIPLYTHPHPDNLGLAESIIKQQQLEIEALKDEVAKWKMSYENSIRFEDGYGHN